MRRLKTVTQNSTERDIARKIQMLANQNKERRKRYLDVDVKITNLKMMLNRSMEQRKWHKIKNLPGVNYLPIESLE